MRIVDTKGMACPKPIIETKKALRDCETGDTFKVITDNQVSFGNISRFLKDNKIKFTFTEEEGVWTFTITKETGETITTSPEDYCEPKATVKHPGNYAVMISSDSMGQGDDELGKKLMRTFFNVISSMDNVPGAIAFYNSGVRLTVDNSEIIETLHELEKKGARIMICGTCADHYKVGKQIHVGEISDMYLITEMLVSVEKIIRP